MAELTYVINLEKTEKGSDLMRIKFGAESHNGPKARDAKAQVDVLVEAGAFDNIDTLFVNGPASLPVAMVLAHGVSHVVNTVACFDPKNNHYVVAVAHGGDFAVGDVIDANEV